MALLFDDVDRFKCINNSLAYSAGDRFLQIVTKRLSDKVRKSDTAARLRGDEFVVIMQNIADDQFALNRTVYEVRKTELAAELLTVNSLALNPY